MWTEQVAFSTIGRRLLSRARMSEAISRLLPSVQKLGYDLFPNV